MKGSFGMYERSVSRQFHLCESVFEFDYDYACVIRCYVLLSLVRTREMCFCPQPATGRPQPHHLIASNSQNSVLHVKQ